MRIETERLILREFNEDDSSRMFEYQNDPRYLKFYEYDNKSRDEVFSLLQIIIGWKNEKPRVKYQFCMELKESSIMIGNCGIRLNNISDRKAEIGYELDPNYWKHGYMREALTSVIEFGKKDLGINTIIAFCHPKNINAINVVMNLGFNINKKIINIERKREEIELEYKM